MSSKKTVKVTTKPKVVKKTTQTVKKQAKKVTPQCFVAGTKIHTDKGFLDIENIKAGDYVWSANPEIHEKALKKVNKIFVRETDSIIRLSINGEKIETTEEHPFYVEGRGWTEASSLKEGDEVRTADGSVAAVEATESIKLSEPVKVYNFEVEDFHTYYVSEQKVLVHNTCAMTAKNSTVESKGTNRNVDSDLSGTVWDNIRATQSYLPNSSIPKSFEMSVGGAKVWVHPNATKHLLEYADRRLSHGKKMIEQQLLNSLHGAVDKIIKEGYEYDKMVKLDNWEIIISAPGRTGSLPVIKHALYKP